MPKKTEIGICGHSLWKYFEYDELIINMRQKDDKDNYSEILGRIRIGSPSDSDISTLKQRCLFSGRKAKVEEIADKLIELSSKSELKFVCILPLNESVDELNNEMLKNYSIKTIEIAAVDSGMRQKNVKKKKKVSIKNNKSKENIRNSWIRNYFESWHWCPSDVEEKH